MPLPKMNPEALAQNVKPFSILLNSPDSPYSYLYDKNTFNHQQALLRERGHEPKTAGYGVRELHDRKRTVSEPIMPGAYRVASRSADEEPSSRAIALTIKNPTVFAGALQHETAPFDLPRMRAMAELALLIGSQLDEEQKATHHQAIQSNIDAFQAQPDA